MLMPVSASSFDDAVAAERGRLLAAQAMVNNPEQKKTVEAVYSKEYCMRRYPEAYANPQKSGIGKLFDNMRIFLTR